jgi:quercetin dioxygenase-like cupin family protein
MEGFIMFYTKLDEAEGIELPGRVWKKLVGPPDGGCKNMIMGVVTFHPGSDPGPHSHDAEEEIIYVLSGSGQTTVGDRVYPLEPGVAVYTEPGIEHSVRNTGQEPLVLLCVFSPPVRPGSYDRKR